MALKQIERAHVLAALADFDRWGTDKVLEDHGFDRARSYLLVHDGKDYPSKAVVGVAHGYAVPTEGPWGPYRFSGGMHRVGAVRRMRTRLSVGRGGLRQSAQRPRHSLRAAVRLAL